MKNLPPTELMEMKSDAAELAEILSKIPKERKPEVLGIIKGFALCAENECMTKAAV